MKKLKTYISLVDSRLFIYLPAVPRRFIRQFQQKEYLTEEAFIQVVCGEKKDRVYYAALKSRTIKMLQALAIISPESAKNPVKKNHEICQKKFLIGQKCLLKGHRKEGIRLIKQVRELALEYDFINLASETASILFNHHVYYEPSKKKANFYREESERHLSNYLAEKKAEHCYCDLVQCLGRSTKPEIIESTIEQLKKTPGTSLKYRVFSAVIQVVYGLHILNYQLVIKTSKNALKSFANEKGLLSSHKQFFLTKLGTAQMAIRDYAQARISFEEAKKYTRPHSYNDYILRLYQTLNALRAGQYHQAYDLYLKNRRCKYEPIREQFAIIEAYLCFLTYSGYLPQKKTFRLGKYLNDTFKAQADKQGDNINILIAELLVHLSRDRGKFIDRIDAVQHYSYRHLKGQETRRAKWFIKILCLLPSVNFHPLALARKAQPYIDRLAKHPVAMGENFALETIPFETLLEMIGRELGRRVA